VKLAFVILSLAVCVSAAHSPLRSPAGLSRPGGAAAASVPAVDLLLDAEGASVGVITTNRLFDGAHTNGTLGHWSALVPDPQVRNLVTNDFNIPLIASVSVNGTTYSDAGSTKRIRGRLTSNTEHSFRRNFGTSLQGQMKCCFFFTLGPTTDLGDFIDLVHIEGSGEYAVIGIQDDGGASKFIRVHSNTNFGSTGPNILVKSNFYYFAQLSYDTNQGPTGYSEFQLRNGTNGALIGVSGLGHGSKQMAQYISFLKTDVHTYNEPHEVTLDNVMLIYSTTGGTATNYLWQ